MAKQQEGKALRHWHERQTDGHVGSHNGKIQRRIARLGAARRHEMSIHSEINAGISSRVKSRRLRTLVRLFSRDSAEVSRTFSQRALTSFSVSVSPFRSLSICPSRAAMSRDIVPGVYNQREVERWYSEQWGRSSRIARILFSSVAATFQ